MIASWQETNDKPKQYVEKQRHFSANKGPHSQGDGLPSGHVWLWQPGRREGRRWNNWRLWTVVLEKTPDSPLDSKEIKPDSLKGDQPWIFTGKTDAEAEVSLFYHLMQTDDSLEKSLLLGKIEGRRRREHQRMRWLDDITNTMNMNFSKLQEMVKDRQAWPAAIHGVTKGCTWLGNWTTTG